MNKPNMIDAYFMDARSKLIDIAAFLDRLDREGTKPDYRIEAFHKALAVLNESGSARTKKVLEVFSDPTQDPVEKAAMQGATGAWNQKESK